MTAKNGMGSLVITGLVALLALSSGAKAQEAEISLDQVPRAVTDSARAKFPGGEIKEASKETEDGKTVYELEMKHDGRNMDVTLKEDGTLVLVETAIPVKEVPEVVMKAGLGKYPGAKLKLAESVKKGPKVKKEVDYYELHLAVGEKSVEVEVDASGKILETEEKKASGKEADEDE
jgi:uncharacterized membrane protein YkoI